MRIKLLGCLLASLLLLTVPAHRARCIELPELGAHSSAVISPERMRAIGRKFMRRLRHSVNIVEDPEITAYIQSLGYRLVAHSSEPSHNFTFFVVQDPTINAFAAPGGYIGVHSGLIAVTQTESELAAVLAHEIAHITQHHLARSLARQKRLRLPLAAALVAAIILSTQNPDIGLAALAATQAGAAQLKINFTRSNEKEADWVGMQILARAGFDPFAMPAFFKRLQQATRYSGLHRPAILRTHPVTTRRIADALGRAKSLESKYGDVEKEHHLQFYLMRAKLQVLTSDNYAQTVHQFRQSLEAGRYHKEAAIRYGYALALMKAGHPDKARQQILKLLEKDKSELSYQLALAQIEVVAGRLKKAYKVYERARALYPSNYAVIINYASALLQGNRPRKARELLRQQLQAGRHTGRLYRLLAQAEGDSGNPAEAHRWLAEYYYYKGQTEKAIKQLQLASQHVDNNFYMRSTIQARLRQLQREAKASQAE